MTTADSSSDGEVWWMWGCGGVGWAAAAAVELVCGGLGAVEMEGAAQALTDSCDSYIILSVVLSEERTTHTQENTHTYSIHI